AEPLVEAWLKRKPEDVVFRRMPAIFTNPLWALHARAYYTAEALGIVDKIHRPLFDAIHKERRPMNTEKDIEAFFAEHGVDPETFRRTFHSFYVEAKVRQAREMTRRYGIDGVPSFIVDGKYRTSPRQAGGNLEVFKVIDFLIEKERKARKG
ncbi:MAG: thiol:disulfide interchange protein DsbA/DsbL, partial [Gammaproteobacteria bacterium]